MKILNIYGQEAWHTEARIIGNREGLEALRQTIDDALTIAVDKASTEQDPEPLFASDGEGYEVLVERHDDQWFGVDLPEDNYWRKEESHPQYIILERGRWQ